ncbi:hypothetical protein [Geminocystis herdmanii]|uniref:hypothetical protein n=1 Tax=Geminocystis herdmanii TaxID=669359 RepID=UPI000344D833|nr:hypothetical protein [Geminocystis herdmanii]
MRELIVKWTKIYPHHWLPLGVKEAIYQGRLKAVSVEQILNIWLKKREVNQSFNYEFSSLIKPNIIFSEAEDQELRYIFTNINNSDNLPSISVEKNNISEDVSIETDNIENSGVNNFEPVNDYSQCFQKLKGFISIE